MFRLVSACSPGQLYLCSRRRVHCITCIACTAPRARILKTDKHPVAVLLVEYSLLRAEPHVFLTCVPV